MLWLLVVILLVLAIGGAPAWGHHSYGWGPSGGLGLILVIILIVLLARGF